MEYLKQLWDNSSAFRIIVCILAAATALAISTADTSTTNTPPSGTSSVTAESIADQITNSLPGTPIGVLGKAQKTVDTAFDVANKSMSTAGKGVDLAGSILDQAVDKIPGRTNTP